MKILKYILNILNRLKLFHQNLLNNEKVMIIYLYSLVVSLIIIGVGIKIGY